MKDPYRLAARWYDRIFEPINRGLRLIGLRMFLPKKGMAILDVGCGTGATLKFYKRYNCKLFGIDPSPAMMGVAQERLGTDANLKLGSGSAMPYPDQSFDLIISMLALHEMEQTVRLAVLDEIRRVMKEGGKALLIDFNPGPIRSFEALQAKAIILVSEIAAGRSHFRNYRQFMARNGLHNLIETTDLTVVKHKTVAGGPLALVLVQK